MRLRFVLPRFNPAVEGVVVARWHVADGDTVVYGDALCDVVVREMTRVQRAHDAGPIAKKSKRRRPKREQPSYATRSDIEVPYRVTTLDAGVVTEILAGAGEWLAVGDVMARIEAEGGEGEAEGRLLLDRIENEGGEG